jgi:hypothetical protein
LVPERMVGFALRCDARGKLIWATFSIVWDQKRGGVRVLRVAKVFNFYVYCVLTFKQIQITLKRCASCCLWHQRKNWLPFRLCTFLLERFRGSRLGLKEVHI